MLHVKIPDPDALHLRAAAAVKGTTAKGLVLAAVADLLSQRAARDEALRRALEGVGWRGGDDA